MPYRLSSPSHAPTSSSMPGGTRTPAPFAVLTLLVLFCTAASFGQAVWTARTAIASPPTFKGCCWGNNLFVATASDGTIYTSPDGMVWTGKATSSSYGLEKPSWGNGRFVIAANNRILTSTNGTDWMVDSVAGGGKFYSACWGNDLFVAMGAGGIFATSADGQAWTKRSGLGAQISSRQVIYANNLFVTVGDDGMLMTSTNGTSWTMPAPVTWQLLYGVARGSGRFVAVGPRDSVITSTDGSTWTRVPLGPAGGTAPLYDITWANNEFVAVGQGGTVITSPDGIQWSKRSSGTATDFYAVAAGNNLFAAVQSGGQIYTAPFEAPGSLALTVYNSATAAVMAGATVRMIAGGSLSTTTNAGGVAVFNNLVPGSYTFSVSATGFADGRATYSILEGQATNGSCFLSPITVPGAPGLTAPANGTTVTNAPTLQWNAVSGAASYTVQLSTDGGFTGTLRNQSVTGTQAAFSSLPYAALIYWRVNAANTAGTSAWSTAWSFRTGIQPPPVPTLSSPANGAAGIPLTTALNWSDATGSSPSFTVQLSTSAGFLSTVFNRTGLSTTSNAVSGLAYGTAYYWRVNAGNSGGNSDWTAAWSFTTVQPPVPATPTLASPADNATSSTTAPTFSWNPSADASSYQLQVALSTAFSSFIFSQAGIAAASFRVSGLPKGQTVYWRVNATNATGSSGWSSIRRLAIAQDASGTLPVGGALPAPGLAVIRGGLVYTLSTPSPVTLSFYDLQGRLVRAIRPGLQASGRHVFDFRIARLQPACYLMVFTTEGACRRLRVMVGE